MIRSHFLISNMDTKLLRHERVIELDEKSHPRRERSKKKKILVMLTAKNSIVQEEDTETMDLQKKN